MATTTQDIGLTRAQLIKVVRTGETIKGVAKMRALAALESRQRKDVGDVLLEVVADKREAPRFRHMAVLGLYKMGGKRADEALAAASKHADNLSAPTIAMALGRVGTAKRLAMIERLESVAAPHAKARATFAATLLAYRHRLEGHDVRAPTGNALQELGRRRSQPIKSAKATGAVAARALAALADEPLELELTTENALRIVCEPNTFVWLWTKDAAGRGFSALAEQKGVAGALFRKRRLEDGYALSAVGLGSPTRAGVRLTVHRAESGKILYSGLVAADGALELKARNHPGLAAVAISARVEAGRVEVKTAKSATLVREARTPKRS
jgi:hypothetical protein